MSYPVIATGSKLSIHAYDPGQTIPFIKAMKERGVIFPVVKSVQSVGLLVEVKRESPNSYRIFRFYNPKHDPMQDIEKPGFDYDKSVRETIAGIRDRVRTPEEWGAVNAIECYNEADPPGVLGHTNMGKLLIKMMDAWDALNLGVPLIFPAFNAGTPEWDEMLALAATGVFQRMKQGGHFMSVHEGTFTGPIQESLGHTIPGAPVIPNAGDMALRYRFLHRAMESVGCGDIPIFVSEWYDIPARDNGTLVASVKWYDAQTAQDSYLFGFAPFTIGAEASGWAWSDYTKQYPDLMEHMVAVKDRKNALSAPTIPPVTPAPVPTPTPPVDLFACRVGLHGRANGRNLPADFAVFRAARVEAVKLLSTADPAEVAALKAIRSDMLIMVRLFASFSGRFVAARDFVTWITPEMAQFYAAGVRLFEIHNEPNLSSEGLIMSGQVGTWATGGEFADWFREVYRLLKAAFPLAQLGFPGLSPGGDIPGVRQAAFTFLAASQSALNLADWVGLHSYWQSADGFGTQEGGFYYQEYQKRTGKPLYVTEFSNSSNAPNSVKGDQYVRYYARLKQETQIKAAFAFVVSSPGDFQSEVWRSEAGQANEIVTKVGARAEPVPPVVVPPVQPTVPVLKPGDLKPVKGNYNQRAQPNATAKVQAIIQDGTVVLVKEISADGQWVRIESTGWISRKAL